jgi:hypothetical protein
MRTMLLWVAVLYFFAMVVVAPLAVALQQHDEIRHQEARVMRLERLTSP